MLYTFPSNVSIRNIKDIHSDIIIHFDKATSVELDIDSCESCDISLIQLLEAARKTAKADGKSLTLTKPANETVQSILSRSGLLDAFSADDAKFWLHKELS